MNEKYWKKFYQYFTQIIRITLQNNKKCMNVITEIIKDIKKCCCPCLLNEEIQQQSEAPLKPLLQIELGQIKPRLSFSEKKISRPRTASCNQIRSLDDQMEEDQQVKQNSQKLIKGTMIRHINKSSIKNNQPPDQQQPQYKPFPLKSIDSEGSLNQQSKSGSQSSFRTVKSTASRPISRRKFKILKSSGRSFGKALSFQQQFYSINQSQNGSFGGGNINKIGRAFDDVRGDENNIEKMNEWIKAQYETFPNKMYKPSLSEIIKMKLETKNSFDNMVHKLEDYYTFYLEDQQQVSNIQNKDLFQSKKLQQSTMQNSLFGKNYRGQSKLSYCYEEQNHQVLCSITATDYTKSFDYEKKCKFMSLIIIPCCYLPPLKFLQWFNKLETQSSLHCFNKIWYLQNSQRISEKIKIEYPLVKVQQYNQKLIGKQSFLLVRQIEVVKFQDQEDKQTILEICSEAQDQKCFERLVRVTAEGSEMCRVQIYIESSQNILQKSSNQMTPSKISKNQISSQYEYFQQRWKHFEQKLKKDHIIHKRLLQIFEN